MITAIESGTPRDESHRASVANRWRELDTGSIERTVEFIALRARPIKARHEQRLNRIVNDERISTHAKIAALWDAVDELGELIRPRSACRKNCSHCCYIPVLIPEQEAALIGKRIGVKPARHVGITSREDIETGYRNPCTLLKNGRCSIYESRPLACRAQFNLDVDSLLCEHVGDEIARVPYMNLKDYDTALALITLKREERIERDPRTGYQVPVTIETSPNVGDIRQFFPRGNRK